MLSEVPEGWQAKPLKTLLSKTYGGGTPSKSEQAYWNGYIYWASVKDMTEFNPVGTKDTITQVGLDNSSSKIVPAGELVFCTRMAVGTTRRFCVDVAINQDLRALIPVKDLDREFLYFWLNYKKSEFEAASTGTTVKGLRQEHLLAKTVTLPPLNEQQRIAEILSSVDASIQATQAVIEQAERVKRGLMEELLTGGLGSEAIERGEVPEGYTKLLSNEIAELKGLQTGPFGSQLKASEYIDEYETDAVRVVMPKDIVGGAINFETAALITEKRAKLLEKHLLRRGDVLFARRGDLSKIAVYFDEDIPALCGTGCLRLRPTKERVNFHFLRYLLCSETNIEWLKRNAVGATMPNLNSDIIGAMPLMLPPIDEQTQKAKILSSVDNFITKQKATIEQQTLTKKGLMDDLLTGKIRTV